MPVTSRCHRPHRAHASDRRPAKAAICAHASTRDLVGARRCEAWSLDPGPPGAHRFGTHGPMASRNNHGDQVWSASSDLSPGGEDFRSCVRGACEADPRWPTIPTAQISHRLTSRSERAGRLQRGDFVGRCRLDRPGGIQPSCDAKRGHVLRPRGFLGSSSGEPSRG